MTLDNNGLRYEYTNGGNKDFIQLCHELEEFLNVLVGGEEKRARYISYNTTQQLFGGSGIFSRKDGILWGFI